MKWILDDIRSAFAALKESSTWLVIGMIALFALLAYAIFQYAIRTDSVLRNLKYTMAACREMTNGPIIFLFCGMMFFLFSAAVTLGEIQRYYHFRRIGSKHEMRQAMKHGIGWGSFAITIAVCGLVFFSMNCT
ncbi:MAG: hypothetical protein IPJ38_08375 [Dechloromonas sp.]|jgi:hypothetical protein|uniref:Uncharacterized protein n=1 Tax=Candidatus Dechloromonas phosphorivorans TaxID=2899244 RepID=A0A935K9B7_9RHOO|nr:hypothetical protein [Candidatus Dechloromonas phosphorivorans]